MWDRRRLQELAQQEADALTGDRLGRLHGAIVRYDGQTLEPKRADAELQSELAAALSAVSVDEIKLLFTVAPKSKVLERLLAARLDQKLAPEAAPVANQDEDSEPEQQ